MKKLLLSLFLSLLVGAQNTHAETASCESPSNIRGVGVGQAESQALADARRVVAEQISVSVKSEVGYSQSEIQKGNDFQNQSSFSKEINSTASVEFAEWIKPIQTSQIDGQFRVVACVNRLELGAALSRAYEVEAQSLRLKMQQGIAGFDLLQVLEISRHTRPLFEALKSKARTIQFLLGGYAPWEKDMSAWNRFDSTLSGVLHGLEMAVHVENDGDDLVLNSLTQALQNQGLPVKGASCQKGLLLRAKLKEKCKEGGVAFVCQAEIEGKLMDCQGVKEVMSLPKIVGKNLSTSSSQDEDSAKGKLSKLYVQELFGPWALEIKKFWP